MRDRFKAIHGMFMPTYSVCKLSGIKLTNEEYHADLGKVPSYFKKFFTPEEYGQLLQSIRPDEGDCCGNTRIRKSN